MTKNSRRLVLVLALLLLAVLVALLARCSCRRVLPATASARKPPPAATAPSTALPSTPATGAALQAEVLTPATIKVPDHVTAGESFNVAWSGPDNPGDFITIVRGNTPPAHYENRTETRHGNPLALLAPMDTGPFEVRYVTARSSSVLGRAPISVEPAGVTLAAPERVTAGASFPVTWTGPNNAADYITIVPKALPDGQYRNNTPTTKGPPLDITALMEPGPAELRYMSGQDARVLARRDILIVAAGVALEGPAQVTAGAPFAITWTGPNNAGDYVTIVPRALPDGQYRNNTPTTKGSPLNITALMDPGPAELRYMSGQDARVLARRDILIVAADVTLDGPVQVTAGAPFAVTWTGPNNSGDYLTIVPKTLPDGQYRNHTPTTKGSPLDITAVMDPGPAELRYMSGQGARVLARRDILIAAAKVTLDAPPRATAAGPVMVAWTGPNNANDYLTIVPKNATDGRYHRRAPTSKGSPLSVEAPAEAGAAEVRYMSGQGDRVLARADIELVAAP
jgi:Ca-activated chloride channel family protein